MPCHNAAATLDSAVLSLLAQTLSQIEIIAVDDGSQDGTAEKLQGWASRDDRLRPIMRPHEGIIPALNAGLESCCGKYIARMDADDWSHPQRLELQQRYLDDHPAVAVVGCLVGGEVAQDGFRRYMEWLNTLISPRDIARQIYIESPLAHPSAMIRREWLDRVGGYKEMGWAEDYDLWLRIHQVGGKFVKLPQVLLQWNDRPDRLTRADSRYSVENFLRAKAHYLCKGPLREVDGVLMWGAGQMGRRISKHLVRCGAPLVAFVDVDPRKLGRTLRDLPVIPRDEIRSWWDRFDRPRLLAAVGSRGARQQIRGYLTQLDLVEGEHWWAVA